MCVLCDFQRPQLGIYVSVRGYSDGVMSVQDVTVQLLCVRGSTDDIMCQRLIKDIISVSEVKLSA